MIPQTKVALTGKQASSMIKLMETLEDNDDVQDVYSNFDVSDEEVNVWPGSHFERNVRIGFAGRCDYLATSPTSTFVLKKRSTRGGTGTRPLGACQCIPVISTLLDLNIPS